MGFPRQEYWSELTFLSSGDLPDPGIEPVSPASPALAGKFFITEPPGKPIRKITNIYLAAIILSDLLPEAGYLISQEGYEARIPNSIGRNGRYILKVTCLRLCIQ